MEAQMHQIRAAKRLTGQSLQTRIEELLRGNGHLRQETVFYQEARNAMLEFQAQMNEAYRIQKCAFQELTTNITLAEERIEEY